MLRRIRFGNHRIGPFQKADDSLRYAGLGEVLYFVDFVPGYFRPSSARPPACLDALVFFSALHQDDIDRNFEVAIGMSNGAEAQRFVRTRRRSWQADDGHCV